MLPPTSEKRKQPLRGEIKGFSRASRRRLLELFARMDVKRSTRAKFLTLTFTGVPTAAEAKAALKRFTMRMQRAYPKWSAVWRFERQRRGSPHFHLLMFNVPYIPQANLQQTWIECTGEKLSILHIKAVHNRKHAMQYISKYIGKTSVDEYDCPPDNPSLENSTYSHDKPGRIWGYVNKHLLPFAELQTLLIDDADLAHYIRWYASATTRGKAGRTEHRTLLYTDDAYKMIDWVRQHARKSGQVVREESERQAKFFAWNARNIAEQSLQRFTAREAKLTGKNIVTYSGVSVDIERLSVKAFSRKARSGLARVTLMTTK